MGPWMLRICQQHTGAPGLERIRLVLELERTASASSKLEEGGRSAEATTTRFTGSPASPTSVVSTEPHAPKTSASSSEIVANTIHANFFHTVHVDSIVCALEKTSTLENATAAVASPQGRT